jgi:small-conductance mechanosensitive channel
MMMRGQQNRRHVTSPLALLALLACTYSPGTNAQAGQAAPLLLAATATTTDAVQPAALATESVVLKVANRPIFTLRAATFGVAPAERERAIQEAIERVTKLGGPLEVTTRPVDDGMATFIDGNLVFRVLKLDVNPESGETAADVGARAARNLQMALAEIREARDARSLLPAVGYSLLATALLAALLWLVFSTQARVARAIHAAMDRRAERLATGLGSNIARHAGLADLVSLPVKLATWILASLFVYEWVGFVLKQFPYTRPWGEALLRNLLSALGTIGAGMLHALPGLMFVVLIVIVTRLIVRGVRGVFEAIREGRIKTALFDETTAHPTGRLLIGVIWLFALVAAYPYLPGSGSEAFKGIGVFVGLMLSIGASGIVNQAVSGLMLMYTRALRPGEFVQIADTEGTVKSVGFLTTRLETLRREEINLPNSLVASNVMRNYSRLAAEGGLGVPAKVTIGYDVPWRQVHAMLLMAAARVPAVATEPPPRVLQTALNDFYVEYTMLVTISQPVRRLAILSDVHASIQDVFNEFGVQIMSPNYEADPGAAKIVPRADWFKAPATTEAAAGAAPVTAAVTPGPTVRG